MVPYYEQDGIAIYHGDCREILSQLGPVDHVITDPPYGLMEDEGKVQMRGAVVGLDYGDWDKSYSFDWIALSRTFHSLTVFHDQKRGTEVWQAGVAAGFTLKQYLYWDKGDSGINPRHNFVNAVEQAIYMRRPESKAWHGGGAYPNIFRLNRCPTPLHPTQKPEELIAWIIKAVSRCDDTILDPFMGSGTTLVAAKRLGRKAIGIELNEKYCEIAVKRLAQAVLPLAYDKPAEDVKLPLDGDEA
jgi:DNA modification methylase